MHWEHDHAFDQDQMRAGERRTLIMVTISSVMMGDCRRDGAGDPSDRDLARVMPANTPFLLGLGAFLILIVLLPELATWLPCTVGQ